MSAAATSPAVSDGSMPSLSDAIAWDQISQASTPYDRYHLFGEAVQFLSAATTPAEDEVRLRMWRQRLDGERVGGQSLLEAFRREIGCSEDTWIQRRIAAFFHVTNLHAARSIWNEGFNQQRVIDPEDLPLLREMARNTSGYDASKVVGLPRMEDELGGEHRVWGSQLVASIFDYSNGPEWFRIFTGQEVLRRENREAARSVVGEKAEKWGLADRRGEMLAFCEKYWDRFATADQGSGLVVFGVNPAELSLERFPPDLLRSFSVDRRTGDYAAKVGEFAWHRVYRVEPELLDLRKQWEISIVL